jgi:hypothetical protein
MSINPRVLYTNKPLEAQENKTGIFRNQFLKEVPPISIIRRSAFFIFKLAIGTANRDIFYSAAF